VVRLEYVPQGPVEQTLLFAGKGLTYDTGGADLKTDGHMAGMSRDKGGAAAVAGFVLAVARLGLPGVKVVAELGVVRNSIGPDSFVRQPPLANCVVPDPVSATPGPHPSSRPRTRPAPRCPPRRTAPKRPTPPGPPSR